MTSAEDIILDEEAERDNGPLMRDNWSHPPGPRKEAVKGMISRGRVALLTGDGGGGKTLLAIQLGFNTSTTWPGPDGRRWFAGGPEIDMAAETCVMATWEDEYDEINRRMLQNPNVPNAAGLGEALGDRFIAVDASERGPIWADDKLTEFGEWLRKLAEFRAAKVLIIDALDSAYAGSEIDRASVRAFIGSWDGWGRRYDCTVLIVAHPPKTEAKYSGSTAWRNGVRTLLHFERTTDDKAILTVDKANYAKAGEKLVLTNWRWWRATDENPEDVATAEDEELRQAIRDALEAEWPLSQRGLCEAVGRRHDRVRKLARDMVANGEIGFDKRSRGHFYYPTASRGE